jgi:hypothetical protein
MSELAFPTTYAWDSVSPTKSVAGGEGPSALSQVLQSTLKQASDAVTQSNKQLTDLQTVQQQLLAGTSQNTQAINANTAAAKSGSGSSPLSTIGSIASSMFGQGSILSPIANGLMRLFGGGSSVPQQVFTPFIAPPSVQLQTTVNPAATAVVSPSPAVQNQGGQGSAAPATQVHIQVQAMDSRSFLDHSDEIAEAVRQALLNSHSLSDVIAEL